jgi:hypothetical protein
MSWNKHIDQVSAKGNRALGFVRRNLKVPNKDLKNRAYKALVRPALEYASTVWDPHTQAAAARLEKVQRRAARWVTGDYSRDSSVTSMLQILKWRSLALRRVDARLCMLYKIRNNLVQLQISSYLRTHRNGIHYQPMFVKPDYYFYSFFPRTVTNWNALNKSILTAPSIEAFKSRLLGVDHELPYAF